jgi:hypothetical protein
MDLRNRFMRTFAFILVAAFLLAEGIAFLPGPCCLNALAVSRGDEPVPCSHRSGARPEGCCAPDESAASPACCSDKADSPAAVNAAPPSCRCRFYRAPESDKSVDGDDGATEPRPIGVVSKALFEIPVSPDLEAPWIREGTGPPGPSLSLILRVLLL